MTTGTESFASVILNLAAVPAEFPDSIHFSPYVNESPTLQLIKGISNYLKSYSNILMVQLFLHSLLFHLLLHYQ